MNRAMCASWHRYKTRWVFGLSLSIAVTYTILMFVIQGKDGFLTNIGFLVLGGLITIFTTLLHEGLRRPKQARDLARALYIELADRIARCCYDWETRWSKYTEPEVGISLHGQMNPLRLKKFSPIRPIIFETSASQISIIPGNAPQSLVKFYFRLEAWRRDIENIAAESDHGGKDIEPKRIRLLTKRLYQTLAPGLQALEMLAPMVDGREQIEATAIAGYDEFYGKPESKTPLRERIEQAVQNTK